MGQTAVAPIKGQHLRALDGVRFAAAFAVMISHATYQVYPPGNWEKMSFAVWTVTHMANFGMTLFFVLSGFVIHLNYRNSVQQPGGLREFFIARWSRLYPLFLVVFVIGFAYHIASKQEIAPLAKSVPFFLTFTTTWWFWRVDDTRYIFSAISNPLLGVMWSLATEAFFYAVYPLLAPLAARLSGRAALIALLCIGALGAIIALGFVRYSEIIQYFGLRYVGIDQSNGSSFLFWLGYHSPLMRLPSFLIGIAAAQFIVSGGRLQRWWADCLFLACFGTIMALEQIRSLFAMVDTSACVFLFACICLAASAEKSYTARLAGASLMVWGGEASYSLYLLHDPIIWSISRAASYLRLPMPMAWVLIGVVVATIVARMCYVWFERPAQRLFKSLGRTLFRLPQ
jgi:peptidoglycan/LPS O-acetylase OafA/YrhL